jgi:hypothetical protein
MRLIDHLRRADSSAAHGPHKLPAAGLRQRQRPAKVDFEGGFCVVECIPRFRTIKMVSLPRIDKRYWLTYTQAAQNSAGIQTLLDV